MERFIKGDIVVIPFPYSDLSNSKRRPALVLAGSSNNDLILCQITSKDTKDYYAIEIGDDDFSQGGLRKKATSGRIKYSQLMKILSFIKSVHFEKKRLMK